LNVEHGMLNVEVLKEGRGALGECVGGVEVGGARDEGRRSRWLSIRAGGDGVASPGAGMSRGEPGANGMNLGDVARAWACSKGPKGRSYVSSGRSPEFGQQNGISPERAAPTSLANRAAPLGLSRFNCHIPKALPWADIGPALWAFRGLI
jgi:hypothetical protein